MRSLTVALFVIGMVAGDGRCQCLVQERQGFLPERGLPTREFFGESVDIDGDTAVVGVPSSASGGRAFVFERRSGWWASTAILVASDVQPGDRFGEASAIDGDVIAIGAPDRGNRKSGGVYIFRRDESGWLQEALLEPLGSGTDLRDAHFGQSVDLEASRLVVGAPGTYRKAVYTYEYDGATWNLVAFNEDDAWRFGKAVRLAGDTLFVGSDASFSDADLSGAVHIFRHQRGGPGWMFERKLGGCQDSCRLS
ncbi:MAG: FG-GAP repeat protein [Planctomycetota bacterium]